MIEPGVPVVAGEELVSPVARQRDGDRAPGHPAHEIGRDLRNVGKRLVPNVRELTDHLDGLPVADLDGGVVRTEVARHLGRLSRLVEGSIGESDGERADRPAGVALHERHDGARIDPPGEECPHRDIGHHPRLHRIRQRSLELIGHLNVRGDQRLPSGPLHQLRQPTSSNAGAGSWPSGDDLVIGHQVARLQFANAAVDGVRRRDAVMAEIAGHRPPIKLWAQIPGTAHMALSSDPKTN